MVMVPGRGRGEDVRQLHAPVDVVAHRLAQAVVVVAAVVDREQVAVLGVEEEEQAVEQNQGGLAYIPKICAALFGERADQCGVDLFEDGAGKVVCDPFLVAEAFGDGVLEEAGLRAVARAEGGPAEEEAEGENGAGVVQTGGGVKVDFVVAAGARAGAAVIEAPDAAVGQDTPADAPVGADIGRGQVAQDLRVRCAGLSVVVLVVCVEGAAEALALGDGEGVHIASRSRLVDGAGLGVGVAEQQMVGDVLVAVAALLGQVLGPAEQLEQRPDQLVLGGGLVDGVEAGRIFEKGERLGAEGFELRGLGQGFLPGFGAADAFFEKVGGEELAGHCLRLAAGLKFLP